MSSLPILEILAWRISISFLIVAIAALLSFLLRLSCSWDSLRLASRAAIEFFRVVVGVVGEDGRFDERDGLASAEDSTIHVSKLCHQTTSLEPLITSFDSRRRWRGDTSRMYHHIIFAPNEAAVIARSWR